MTDKQLSNIYGSFIHTTFEELTHPITNLGVNTIDVTVPTKIMKLLGLGMKCALPPKPNMPKYKEELLRFRRSLLLHFYFGASSFVKSKFYVPNPWMPPLSKLSPIALDAVTKFTEEAEKAIQNVVRTEHNTFNAVSEADIKELREFAAREDIIIQNADKGLGLTVMPREWYDKQGAKIVNTYNKVTLPQAQAQLARAHAQYQRYCRQYIENTEQERKIPMLIKYLTQYPLSSKTQFPLLYLMPKLHKNPVSVRPIVADHSSVFTPAAKVVGDYFAHMYTNSETIISDTKKFILELEELKIPPNAIFATADITNLYGEIPLDSLKQLLLRSSRKTNTNIHEHNLMCHIAVQALDNNYLEFNNEIYHQDKGVAMGSALGPTMANVYLNAKVDAALREHEAVHFTRRFLDDVFFVLDGNTNIPQFQQDLDNIDRENMKFTLEHDKNSVSFLDLVIYKHEDGLRVRNYVKPTNKFLYIPYKSFHTEAVKRGFIITELTRLVKNNSTFEDFTTAAKSFAEHLKARGYPAQFIMNAARRVDYGERDTILRVNKNNKADGEKRFFYVSHLDHCTRSKRLQMTIRNLAEKYFNKLIPNIRGKVIIALTKSPKLYSLITKNKANFSVSPQADQI